MPRAQTSGKANRGPAAAAGNRQAIIEAARRVFAARGYHAPLSAVAKEAGVGQAVLYRHFSTRLDLAFAVFDDHWASYEEISADPDPGAFERLWSRIVDKTIEEAAFVEMVVDARRSIPDYEGVERIRELLRPPLDRAIAAGLVDVSLTVDDVMLAQRMVYGVVVTAVDPRDVRDAVKRALGAASRLPPLVNREEV